MVLPRFVPVALCLLFAGCIGDGEDQPTVQERCRMFEDELCGKLASCQPPSEQRDYADVCYFVQSVYTTCGAASPAAFDACISFIRNAACPANGGYLLLPTACAPLAASK